MGKFVFKNTSIFLLIFSLCFQGFVESADARPLIQKVSENTKQLSIADRKPLELRLSGSRLEEIKSIRVMQNNRPKDSMFEISLSRASRGSRSVRITPKAGAKPGANYAVVAIGARGEKVEIPFTFSLVQKAAGASSVPQRNAAMQTSERPTRVERNQVGGNQIRVTAEQALRDKGGPVRGRQQQMAETVKIQNFKINGGGGYTDDRNVVLYHTAINNPTEYRVGERSNLTGIPWKPYVPNPAYTLSSADGTKTVYFEIRGPDVPSPAAPNINLANVAKANDRIRYESARAKYRGDSYYRHNQSNGVLVTGKVNLELIGYPTVQQGTGNYEETVKIPVAKRMPDENCKKGVLAGKRKVTRYTMTNKTAKVKVNWEKKSNNKVLIKVQNPSLYSEGNAAMHGIVAGNFLATASGNQLTAKENFMVYPASVYRDKITRSDCIVRGPKISLQDRFEELLSDIVSPFDVKEAFAAPPPPATELQTVNVEGTVEWSLTKTN